uniref:PGG domain-containing protein n=1 Tax=Noccaea caerulescens TaxID=107243 RepID=A0A1J3J7Z3_NOCCA
MEVNGREESSDWFVEYLRRQGDWLEKTRGNLMVAATVIASMSFQVMVNPPGGVWQGDPCPSRDQAGTVQVCAAKAGTSVLEDDRSKRELYLGMVISSVVSFTASMSLILLVISGLQLRNRLIMAILVTFMVVAVFCMVAAFLFAVALVQSDNQIIVGILVIYVVFWIVFPVLIIISQLVRFLCWLLCCRPRLRRLMPSTPSSAH